MALAFGNTIQDMIRASVDSSCEDYEWTMCCWFKATGNGPSGDYDSIIDHSGGLIQRDGTGNGLAFWFKGRTAAWNQIGSAVGSPWGTDLGVWHFAAMTSEGILSGPTNGDVTVYFMKAGDTSLQSTSESNQQNGEAGGSNQIWLGGNRNNLAPAEEFYGSIAAVKIWTADPAHGNSTGAVLNEEQIWTESQYWTPQHLDSLGLWLPCREYVGDDDYPEHMSPGFLISGFVDIGDGTQPSTDNDNPPITWAPDHTPKRNLTRGANLIYHEARDGSTSQTFTTAPNKEGNLQVMTVGGRSGPVMWATGWLENFATAFDNEITSHDTNWKYGHNNSGAVMTAIDADDELKYTTLGSPDTHVMAYYDVPTNVAQSAFCEAETHATGGYYGVGCRLDGSGNGYILEAEASGAGAPWRLLRLDAGAITVLDSGTFGHAADNAGMWLVAGGRPYEHNNVARLRAYGWDDFAASGGAGDLTLLADIEDPTYLTGKTGVWFRGAINVQLDDFGAEGVQGWYLATRFWPWTQSTTRREQTTWWRQVPASAVDPQYTIMKASNTAAVECFEFEPNGKFTNPVWHFDGSVGSPGSESGLVSQMNLNPTRVDGKDGIALATVMVRHGLSAEGGAFEEMIEVVHHSTGGDANSYSQRSAYAKPVR